MGQPSGLGDNGGVSDDLIAFVNARLDEAASAANAAAQSGNQFAGADGHDPRWQQDPGHNGGEIRDMCSPRGCIVVFDEGAPGREQAAHIARHDPARVLREVGAKRKIIAEHKAVTRLAGLTEQDLGFLGWYREWVLKNLAAADSDHPDYRPEWKP
jgi:hypothetical protein